MEKTPCQADPMSLKTAEDMNVYVPIIPQLKEVKRHTKPVFVKKLSVL